MMFFFFGVSGMKYWYYIKVLFFFGFIWMFVLFIFGFFFNIIFFYIDVIEIILVFCVISLIIYVV